VLARPSNAQSLLFFFIRLFPNLPIRPVTTDSCQETVLYVGNIYKYYVAYKLAQEQGKLQQK
jgi:hypothetical protein